MVNCSTGEIFYTKDFSYAFSMTSNDVGFGKLLEVLRSCCRGTRQNRSPIQVRFFFHEAQNNQQLPFPASDDFETPYDVKKF